MGYSTRSWDYRYTLWMGFNPKTFQVNLSDVHAGELYMLEDDPGQDNNVYDGAFQHVMRRKMAALPQNTSLQDRMRLQLFYLTSEMRSRRNDKEEGTQWINRWETNKREEGEP